jgi:hypothetical protein
MMNDIIEAIKANPKITTRDLSDLTNVNQLDLAAALNDEIGSGTVIRHTVFVENGTPRSTLAFGWSCPATL